MKLGISTACFFNRRLTEGSLAEIARLGVRTTEVFFATRSEYSAPYFDAIAAAARGLDVHSVHAMCTQFEPQLFAVNERQRADAEVVLDEFLGAARALGARHYTFHGLLKLKRREYRYDYDALAATVNAVAARCAAYGVTLCYENVHYGYYSFPAYFATLGALCPALGAVLDVKQAIQGGGDYRAFVAAARGRLRTLHLCDMKGGRPCLPGQGDIDWDEFFATVAEAGFDGAALLEVYPENYRGFDELRSACDYLAKKARRVYPDLQY